MSAAAQCSRAAARFVRYREQGCRPSIRLRDDPSNSPRVWDLGCHPGRSVPESWDPGATNDDGPSALKRWVPAHAASMSSTRRSAKRPHLAGMTRKGRLHSIAFAPDNLRARALRLSGTFTCRKNGAPVSKIPPGETVKIPVNRFALPAQNEFPETGCAQPLATPAQPQTSWPRSRPPAATMKLGAIDQSNIPLQRARISVHSAP